MKAKYHIQSLFIILLLLALSPLAFAIQGSDSSGTITSYSGTTGAAAASGSSSDSTVSGGRVSTGGSAVSSAYGDGSISGNPGADLSTEDTAAETGTGTQTSTETDGGLNSIPSGGGGGGGEAAEAESAEQTEVEAEAGADQSTEATEAGVETQEAAPAENAVTVAIELSEGNSVALAPQTGAASMSVVSVTATAATIVITSDGQGNSITGGVVYNTDQEITMEVGQTIDVDSDNDGTADMQVTLTRIDYNPEAGKYEGIFTFTYLHPTEEIVSFVREQVERGEVAFVKGQAIEEISFAYWIWIIVGIFVIAVVACIVWALMGKKKKPLPTTIPTHYFEKLMRQEISTHKKTHEAKEEQKESKLVETKESAKEKKQEERKKSIGTPTIIPSKAAIKKKGKKKKRTKKKKSKRKGKKRFTK